MGPSRESRNPMNYRDPVHRSLVPFFWSAFSSQYPYSNPSRVFLSWSSVPVILDPALEAYVLLLLFYPIWLPILFPLLERFFL